MPIECLTHCLALNTCSETWVFSLGVTPIPARQLLLPRCFSVTESTCQCRRCEFNPWVRKNPLERVMATHSSILPWETPRTGPGGLQSVGSQRVRHAWATEHTNSVGHRGPSTAVRARHPAMSDGENKARVPPSFWLCSLHSEAWPLIDSFIRRDVVTGWVSILWAPRQLTLATLKLWSWLRILCLMASSAWHLPTFKIELNLQEVTYTESGVFCLHFLKSFLCIRCFSLRLFLRDFFFLNIRCLTVRDSIKKKPSSQHENIRWWSRFYWSRVNTLSNIIHHLYKGLKLEELALIGAAIASLLEYQTLTKVFIPPSIWGE